MRMGNSQKMRRIIGEDMSLYEVTKHARQKYLKI
jgi:hypothetical protein